MPESLPPAAVEAGIEALAWMYHGVPLTSDGSRAIFANEVQAVLTAALPHLRAHWEGEVRAAYREGFEHGQDSASTFERGGGSFGCDHYWSASETLAALRAPTAPSGEAP